MLEELRDNVLSLLEERVELAINTIQSLREDKLSLESQISQLQGELQQKEEWIHDLENRNQELLHVESDLKQLQEARDQERDEIDREKTEIRERIEGLMTMLNGVNGRQEELEADQLFTGEDTSDLADISDADMSDTELAESDTSETEPAESDTSEEPAFFSNQY